MGLYNDWPSTNLHSLNLDYILKQIKKLESQLSDFVKTNTIKYANPIIFDPVKTYQSNTVVIDGETGNAYISVAPVPVNSTLSDSETWTKIYNYDGAIDDIKNKMEAMGEEIKTELNAYIEDVKVNVELVNTPQYAVAPQIIGTDVYPITDTMTAGVNVQLSCVCADDTYIYGFYPHNDATNLVGIRRYHVSNNTIEKDFDTFVGGHANSAAILPDGRILCVQLQLYRQDANAVQNGNIVIIDSTTMKTVQTVTLPFLLQSVSYDHKQNKLYVWDAEESSNIYEVDPSTWATTLVGTIRNGLGTRRRNLQDMSVYDGTLCVTSYDGLVGWCKLEADMYPFEHSRHYTPMDADGRRWIGETSGLEYAPDGRLIQTFYTTITPAVLGMFAYVNDTHDNLIAWGHPNATGRSLNLDIALNEYKFYIGPSQLRSLAEAYAYVVGSYSMITVVSNGTDMCVRAIPLRDGMQLVVNGNITYTLSNLQVSGYSKVLVSNGSTLNFNGQINTNAIDLESFGGDIMIGGFGTINNNCKGCLTKLGQRGTVRTAQLNGTNLTISDNKNKLSSYQLWQTDYRYINFTTI